MSTVQLDITAEHCPMTFVKTKLQLARLQSGDILEVQLREGEPLDNVPKAAAAQGHTILESKRLRDDIHLLRIQKK